MSIFSTTIMRRPGIHAGQGLTTAQLGDVDVDALNRQHQAYVDALISIGIEVIMLPALEKYPDSYFVEDTAIITKDVAVITRPGAPTRRGEAAEMEPALAGIRSIRRIEAPGTLDGGDVLIMGQTCFIGVSDRTNESGAMQLSQALSPGGFSCVNVPVGAGLHLKSSVNAVGPDTLLVAPDFADRPEFKAYSQIVLDKDETYAANVLWLNDHLIMPSGYPRTRKKLEKLNIPIIELDMSEPRKMDGGLTCLSLRF